MKSGASRSGRRIRTTLDQSNPADGHDLIRLVSKAHGEQAVAFSERRLREGAANADLVILLHHGKALRGTIPTAIPCRR